jgi:hypothetical protein
VYVSSYGSGETDGRIDIFNPEGEFITEINNPNGPREIAVDSVGTLHVRQQRVPERIVRYEPNEFPPTSAVDYGSPVVVDAEPPMRGIAVNCANDHLLIAHPTFVKELNSAAEGNAVVAPDLGLGNLRDASGIAVDASTGNFYVGTLGPGKPAIPTDEDPFVSVVNVFDASGALIGTIDGSEIPVGGFTSAFGWLYPAIDEQTDELFISDGTGTRKVYRFLSTGGASYEYQADPELEEHTFPTEAKSFISSMA